MKQVHDVFIYNYIASTNEANNSCHDNSVMVTLIVILVVALIIATVVCIITSVLLRKLKSSVQ